MGRVGVAAAVVTGLLALTVSSVSSRAQNVAGGKVMSERRSASLDFANALAIQRNGRLVVAGRSVYGGVQFALARYTLSGKLDPSFGSGGKVLTANGSASALAIQHDGKLVAGGQSRVTAHSDDFAVVRYTGRGRLDPTFGRGGKVLTDFGSRKRISGVARALAIQADGKLVVAGTSGNAIFGPGRFTLARYTAGGKLDSTFGTGGKVVTHLGGSSEAWAVAIQRDGKIVAAGSSDVRQHRVFALARYTVSGKLDPSFGSEGKVLTDVGSGSDARALAIQADGKLVVAGRGGFYDFAVVRYTADGKLDPSFGGGGKVVTNFGFRYEDESEDEALAVALQTDGKLLVAGWSDARGASGDYKPCCISDFALARYNIDGSLDPSFGSGGKVLSNFVGSSGAQAIGIEANGKIVAAGGGAGYFALARYTARGKLDPTFGSGGKVVTNFGFIQCPEYCSQSGEGAGAVAIQADGRIVVAGGSDARGEYGEKDCCISDFALVRYTADGSLDPSFGSGGKVLTSFVGDAGAQAVGIQEDGKIVAAGGGAGSFDLARYSASGKLDPSFGSGGKVVTNFRKR